MRISDLSSDVCSSDLEVIGCDFHHLLHGEQHFTYEGLVYAGDDVVVTTRVEDFYEKRGGLLEFVVLLSTISHADRGVLVRSKRMLLHKSEEHTSELQSLMRISYDVFCLKKKKTTITNKNPL